MNRHGFTFKIAKIKIKDKIYNKNSKNHLIEKINIK